jgi:hypothetical protein
MGYRILPRPTGAGELLKLARASRFPIKAAAFLLIEWWNAVSRRKKRYG